MPMYLVEIQLFLLVRLIVSVWRWMDGQTDGWMIAVSLQKHQMHSLSLLRLLRTGNNYLNNHSTVKTGPTGSPAPVYTETSSQWVQDRTSKSQAQTRGPWALSLCFLLPPIVLPGFPQPQARGWLCLEVTELP